MLFRSKKADAIQPTKETQDGIALVTQRLAGEQKNKLAYDKALAEASAAAKAGKWQEALDAYKKADAVQSTKEAQDGIALATQQKLLGEQRNKLAYDKALAEALAAVKAGKWQEALDAYKKADAIQPTKETQDGIALSTQKLAGDTRKKAAYDKALAAARDAMTKEDYKAAADAIALALSIIPDGPEAKALEEQLGPTLTIIAELDGAEHKGAHVSIDGNTQKLTTPATFRLKKGKSYEIEVTIPPSGPNRYTTARKAIKLDTNTPEEYRAAITRLRTAPTPEPPVRPPVRPEPPPTRPVLTPTPLPRSMPAPAPTTLPSSQPTTAPGPPPRLSR